MSMTAEEKWGDRVLNPYRKKAILEYSGKSFVDVGCGNGAYVMGLADKYETMGVDIHPYPSWEQSPEKFRESHVASLPFEDGTVETIVCFEVLEHLSAPDLALKEFHRVCAKNIIITVPNCRLEPGMEKSRLTYFHYTDETHCNYFTLETLADLIKQAGFTSVKMELINPVDIAPFLSEIFPGSEKLWRKIYNLFAKKEFNMTCLIVAEK
jgi:SAM-dependent methyltransferase